MAFEQSRGLLKKLVCSAMTNECFPARGGTAVSSEVLAEWYQSDGRLLTYRPHQDVFAIVLDGTMDQNTLDLTHMCETAVSAVQISLSGRAYLSFHVFDLVPTPGRWRRMLARKDV